MKLGTVIPEVCTKLDAYRQGRNADAIVMGVSGGRRTLVAVEAKAAEDFGKVYLAVVAEVANRPTRPQWNSDSFFKRFAQ